LHQSQLPFPSARTQTACSWLARTCTVSVRVRVRVRVRLKVRVRVSDSCPLTPAWKLVILQHLIARRRRRRGVAKGEEEEEGGVRR
jgi:hypothetical protein